MQPPHGQSASNQGPSYQAPHPRYQTHPASSNLSTLYSPRLSPLHGRMSASAGSGFSGDYTLPPPAAWSPGEQLPPPALSGPRHSYSTYAGIGGGGGSGSSGPSAASSSSNLPMASGGKSLPLMKNTGQHYAGNQGNMLPPITPMNNNAQHARMRNYPSPVDISQQHILSSYPSPQFDPHAAAASSRGDNQNLPSLAGQGLYTGVPPSNSHLPTMQHTQIPSSWQPALEQSSTMANWQQAASASGFGQNSSATTPGTPNSSAMMHGQNRLSDPSVYGRDKRDSAGETSHAALPPRSPLQSHTMSGGGSDGGNNKRSQDGTSGKGKTKKRSVSGPSGKDLGDDLLEEEDNSDDGADKDDRGNDRPQTKRRKRANMSCTQCKSRKIKCDRARPICASCVRRGVPPQHCVLGDERDAYEQAMMNTGPSHVATLMDRIARLEDELERSRRQSKAPSSAALTSASGSDVPEKELAARATAEALREENYSVAGSSSRGTTKLTDAMDQRLLIDGQVSQKNAQDRMRASSLVSGISLSSATSFALGHQPVDVASVEDMMAVLPSEANILHLVNIYYDQIEYVYQFLPPRTSLCSRITDLLKRWQIFQTSNRIPETTSDTAPAASTANKSLRSSIAGSLKSSSWRNSMLPSGTSPAAGSAEDSKGSAPAKARPSIAESHSSAGTREEGRSREASVSVSSRGSMFNKSDFAFLALIFAIIETTAEMIPDADLISLGISCTTQEILPRLSTYHRHCMSLLSMSDMLAEPTIEGLQAVHLLGQYYFSRQRRTEYSILNTMCLRMAETIGLHKLGSAKSDATRWAKQKRASTSTNRESGIADDEHVDDHRGTEVAASSQNGSANGSHSALLNRTDLHGWFLPKGTHKDKWEQFNVSRWFDGNHAMREVGRKVFWQGVMIDWQLATLHDGVYHVKEGMFTTGMPLNAEAGEIERAADPLAIASEEMGMTEILMAISRATRATADAMNAGKNSYEDMKEIERGHRSILANLPMYYRFDGPTFDAEAVARLHAQKPYLSVQRVVIFMYVHHRLLKLHRLYMPRAYPTDDGGADSKYIESRQTCLDSAGVILSCFNELVQSDAPIHRFWAFRMWLFDAISTLQIDLLYRIAQPLDPELIGRQADVEQGIRLLQPHTTLEKSNKFLGAATSALRTLQKEEKMKRIAYRREQMAAQARIQAIQLAGQDGSESEEKVASSNGVVPSGDTQHASNDLLPPPTPVSVSAMALLAFEAPSPMTRLPGDPNLLQQLQEPQAGVNGEGLLDELIEPLPAAADGSSCQLNVNDLDQWLRSVSGHMMDERNIGAARLIDRLLGEMDFGDFTSSSS